MAKLFGLTAVGLTSSAAEVARGHYLRRQAGRPPRQLSLPSMILSLHSRKIPSST